MNSFHCADVHESNILTALKHIMQDGSCEQATECDLLEVSCCKGSLKSLSMYELILAIDRFKTAAWLGSPVQINVFWTLLIKRYQRRPQTGVENFLGSSAANVLVGKITANAKCKSRNLATRGVKPTCCVTYPATPSKRLTWSGFGALVMSAIYWLFSSNSQVSLVIGRS